MQRGGDRRETFSGDEDRRTYLRLRRENLRDAQVRLLAWRLVFVILLCILPLHAQNSPASRPILFVHGWCQSAYDWAPLYPYLFQNLPSGLYPNHSVYLVEYDSGAGTVTFWSENDPTAGSSGGLTQVAASSIPSTARFFAMEFVDPVAHSTAATDVTKISILNKAFEISQVIKQITAVTQSQSVNILAHSMGGLDARAYVENLASAGACYNYSASTPLYSGTCKPGAGNAAFAQDAATIISLDTPHAGSTLATPNALVQLASSALPQYQCEAQASTNMSELLPQAQGGAGLLESLNYSGTSMAGVTPQTNPVPIQAIVNYFSDVTQAWDGLSGYSDDLVTKDSQSITGNLPATNSAASLQNVVISYLSTDSNVTSTSGCYVSLGLVRFPMLHVIECLGLLPNTQSKITAQLTAAAASNTFTVGGTAVTVQAGATTGNTSTLTVTPEGGFTGSVTLTAAVTTSPSGAQDPPTFSFGSTSPVSITGTAAGTATLTISTTAPSTSSLTYPSRWRAAQGGILACVVLFGIPDICKRRRHRRAMLAMVAILVTCMCALLACGSAGGGGKSGAPGTTPGTYVVTVTGASGDTTASGTFNLVVQ
jgi:pimeloyl-ACP methyl ester carboxylesterase